MNVIAKLAISLVIAGIAFAIVNFLGLTAPVPLFLAFAATACACAMLGSGSGSQAITTSQSTHHAPSGDNSEREEGEVKWFNSSKGFGFIIREDGEEIFVHYRSIVGADQGRRSLRDGQRVSYTVADSDKGPQAEEVEPLD